MCFGFLPGEQIGFERIQARVPELFVTLEPGLGLAEALGTQAEDMLAAEDAALDEAGALEDFQVLGDGVEGDAKGAGDFGDSGGAGLEADKDFPAGRIGDGAEDAVERQVRIFNHTVEYYRASTRMSREKNRRNNRRASRSVLLLGLAGGEYAPRTRFP